MYKITSRANHLLTFLYPVDGVQRPIHLEPKTSITVDELTDTLKNFKSKRLIKVQKCTKK